MSANQNKNFNQGHAGGTSTGDDDDKSMPMGIGDMNDQQGLDLLANTGERKKVNAGSLVLAFVVILAGIGVFSMRALSHVGGATGGRSDVESTIEKFLLGVSGASKDPKNPSILTATDTSIIEVLSDNSYTQRQVPLTNVHRNPFIIEGDAVPLEAKPATDPMVKKQADRRAQFEQAGARLQLKSIVMSNVPLAIVSGKIVRMGDQIVSDSDNIAFRVAEITADAVTVVAEDEALDVTVPVKLVLKRDR